MIEFENVSFSYTGQEHGGLRDINLKISDGEFVLFCGRSGCGKTTITRLVNGLIPQFYQGELHGRVLVDGQEISNIPMYQIAAKVGSVFQNPRTQFFNVDTDSEIAFGIENEARPPEKLAERVEQTTEDLHIQKLRNRNIFELSGGEKQKIAFASVYAMNPQIYLLDEPSSNLDMTSIQELKEHLRLIKKQGKTVLIAEHRLYYLMELADRIVYLEKGEIKGIYTPEEFWQLSEPDREHMGLRAVDLQAVFPQKSHLPAPTPVLDLRNVTLRYKKQTILHDIELSAGKGEVIGVVGHNGAGKTTFSRALCGLHKDCDGQFLWESEPIERKERLKRSYMVMQDVNYELFADSVEAECSFGIRNPDQTLVNATLEELGLTQYRERHPNTLSGGQKQRVAVAVSMICGKDLLVFDEPTSGLDFDSMTQVAGMIRRLSNIGALLVQFFAHLFPNLITSSVVDLRVDCKGRAGLSASGFCGHRCHTDIGIRQQNADEGVPEHMRMQPFNACPLSDPANQCAVAVRVDRKSMVVADHEVRSPKGKERGRILAAFLIQTFLPTPSHQFFLGLPILIIFFEEVHVLWSNVHIPDVAFLCRGQLVAVIFEYQKRFRNMYGAFFKVDIFPCQSSQFATAHTGIEQGQNDYLFQHGTFL